MKRLHLIISAIVLVPVAFTYGAAPGTLLQALFDFKVVTIDLHNVFRATMGLYIAMVIFWLTGIFKARYWEAATITNVFFMAGLGVGRAISFAVDGIPSVTLVIGFAAEIILAAWGYFNLKKYKVK